MVLTVDFKNVGMKDVPLVGGKNASLGEMISRLQPMGIRVPGGFATTSQAFRLFLKENQLEEKLKLLLSSLDRTQFSNLVSISKRAKDLVLNANLPLELSEQISTTYKALCNEAGMEVDVAVRSSATAEDLPNASFAGQHDSFLNVTGEKNVLNAVRNCFASLYNARAIKYRVDNGFDHDKVALSAGIQRMVRSDKASSGVCFTIDPDSGFRHVVVITGCWGLGENIVQGTVVPDEFHLFKPSVGRNARAIISKRVGSKSKTMIYASGGGTTNIDTSPEKQAQFVSNDKEIELLGQWAVKIEEHYGMPMDIEWARDGNDGQLYIVQARPETVHSTKNVYQVKEYSLKEKGKALVKGSAVGAGIISGVARIIASPADSDLLKAGEILITEQTNPDWDPIMKRAAAIVTSKGGRTSHAAIVARECGAIAIVGAEGATEKIKNGQTITVDTSQGKFGVVYDGALKWTERELDFRNVKMPATKPMLILADPDKAYKYSFYPNQGVGLMRMEFAVTNSIRVHPMALVKFDELKDGEAKRQIEALTAQYTDKKEYFVDKLSQAIGTIAAAFYPKDVIVRMSDFKTNEYAGLLGGKQFEPEEENPMIGFRGASRYYDVRYRDGFRLECAAVKRVREEMGLTNVKVMIPFCRTVEEGKSVLQQMAEFGLRRGENGLQVYVMAEIPSNVILAESFAEIFDGFSIGSNDLTQLTLGIDRDSAIVSGLFNESNPAVKELIRRVISVANKSKVGIGLCGQAPSDDPAFAAFLVNENIGSISFNPDALLKGIDNMNMAEAKKQLQHEKA